MFENFSQNIKNDGIFVENIILWSIFKKNVSKTMYSRRVYIPTDIEGFVRWELSK